MPLLDNALEGIQALDDEMTREDMAFVEAKAKAEDSDEEEQHQLALKALQEAKAMNEALLQSKAADHARYTALVTETESVPLAKLVVSPAGCALFDELCLRVDVNQRYADALPQWKDVASQLQVDALRTQWVEACVRPNEGLTRAVMEIYMRDGGTLGDVLKALIDLELTQIVGQLEPRVRAFIEERQNNKTADAKEGPSKVDPRFFSVLSTLASVLGGDDPCIALQKFVNGLKRPSCEAMQAQSHDLIVHNATVEFGNDSAPSTQRRYSSKLHLKEEDKALKFGLVKGPGDGEVKTCRIMLLFADDGVQYSQEVYELIQGMEFKGVKAEVFRLNESSLWYEMLIQPEACCMKWANEADYVVPILTPNLLRQFQGAVDNSSDGSIVPTSPTINRFMYTLLRARFVESGCKNTVVRPIVPASMTGPVGGCAAVKRDPLLRLVWVPLKEERVVPRVRAMLGECEKRWEQQQQG